MKSKEAIQEKIKSIEFDKENYRKAYVNGNISRIEWIGYIHDCNAIIKALKWVLDESDSLD